MKFRKIEVHNYVAIKIMYNRESIVVARVYFR